MSWKSTVSRQNCFLGRALKQVLLQNRNLFTVLPQILTPASFFFYFIFLRHLWKIFIIFVAGRRPQRRLPFLATRYLFTNKMLKHCKWCDDSWSEERKPKPSREVAWVNLSEKVHHGTEVELLLLTQQAWVQFLAFQFFLEKNLMILLLIIASA